MSINALAPQPSRRAGLVSAVAATVLFASASRAAALRPITMDDVIHIHGGHPQNLSLDHDHVLGDLDTEAQNPGDHQGDRHMVEWGKDGSRSIAAGFAPARSPDGRWLLFADGEAWILKDLKTGSKRTFATSRKITVWSGPPVWSSDSRFVAANFLAVGDSPYRQAKPTQLAPGVRAIVHDQRDGAPAPAPMDLNPQLLSWDVGQAQPAISPTGGYESFPGSWRTTAQGHDYYYAIAQEGGVGLKSYTIVKALNAETKSQQDVYRLPNFNQWTKPQIEPDGDELAFVADPTTPEFAVSGRIMLFDIQRHTVRSLAPDTPVTALRWGRDGRIYFLKQGKGSPQLSSVDLAGQIRVLTHDVIARRDLVASPDGEALAYRSTDGYGRSDLREWSIPLQREQVLETFSDPAATFKLGQFQPTQWITADGVTLSGFLIFPSSFDARRRYPLIVDIHGGGPGAALGYLGLFGVSADTPLDWHAWAALGFIVFVPDYRSSGEYGAAINTKVANAPADLGGVEVDAMDIASGVEALLKQPYIDESRLTAVAQSAGAARLAYLLTRSQMFAAAVLHDAIPFDPDALTMSLAKFGGPALWTRAKLPPAEQRALSPNFTLDGWRVKTPTLILVGDQAHGSVDPISSETLYAMLLSAGVPTRFVHYTDDGHQALSVETAKSRFDEVLTWLQRYAPARASDSRASQTRTHSSIASAR